MRVTPEQYFRNEKSIQQPNVNYSYQYPQYQQPIMQELYNNNDYRSGIITGAILILIGVLVGSVIVYASKK